MGWDEVSAVNDEIWETRQQEIKEYLDKVAVCLVNTIDLLHNAWDHIDTAYNGYDPGPEYPDSQNARAWDYLGAISIARDEIINRLETWDGYVR